ncbi:spondin domain-containing protein [Prevotella sp. 10(H)]|uniref:spondin domain-containing protein n=1 Tax=Prevotella sp. 10(H) TaxID=1158294 RepID=UPI0004A6C7FE|nr:spondin domain-containing protein [Prevotella sp. 10(H)]
MKRKFLSFAVIASFLLTGAAFTSCSDDDDDDVYYDTESTILFENVTPLKEFVQSGKFAGVAVGESVTVKFHAAKGQHLMFATMYGYSNDMFFAPENPGLKLFNDDGTAITGDVSSEMQLWDNGTRVNEQPSSSLEHPGVADTGTIQKILTQDAQGNLYRPAGELVKLNLAFNANTSEFTLTIRNNSGGTINETPLSPGVWAVSNVLGGNLVKAEPFFKLNEKSSAQLTELVEKGNNAPLGELVTDMTGIITGLSPVLVVVYSGDINPIYQLDTKDKKIGLKELTQKGDASVLKASLEGMTNVRHVYVIGNSLAPGESNDVRYKAWKDDNIAYATMFGYSNDWFYSNSETIKATSKGDMTAKTVLLDSGTGVNQYPGAGNHQALFGGTPQAEDVDIKKVDTTYPVPQVSNVIKVTIK